ncbi:MAG: hypothetical protein SF066_16950 [Thermoanaerobaculia bacterium]|nr:hypothetical protein [Thermoanaerobaculia bacterium]
MKRRSDTRAATSLRDLTFFTDRDLGKAVPRILREHGYQVEWYFDHFAEGERVEDNRWLEFAIRNDWIAISHDDNIRRDVEAVRTVMENHGRLFILRGALGGRDLASVFLEATPSVTKLVLDPELARGFIANVRRTTGAGGVVKSAAYLMLAHEDWKTGQGQKR